MVEAALDAEARVSAKDYRILPKFPAITSARRLKGRGEGAMVETLLPFHGGDPAESSVQRPSPLGLGLTSGREDEGGFKSFGPGLTSDQGDRVGLESNGPSLSRLELGFKEGWVRWGMLGHQRALLRTGLGNELNDEKG